LIVFEFFLLAASLLAVAVSLRRTRAAEAEAEAFAKRAAAPADPAERTEALAALGMVSGALCDSLVSSLTVVLAQCELARNEDESSPRWKAVEHEARRMAALVERNRGLAPGRIHETESFDPLVLADEVLEVEAPAAAARGVSIHRLYDDVRRIEGHRTLWARVLRHLVQSAVRTAPAGLGDVTLAVGELDGDLVFCVADDGPGMDEHQVRTALRPFDGEGPVVRSTGVSYAIAAAMAEATGARLALESEPGGGTRAALRVPLAASAKAPGIEPLAPRARSKAAARSR